MQRQYSVTLKAQVPTHILRNLSDEPLERQLADQELRRLLELANFTERDGARTEPVRLLDAAGGRRRLSGGLGGEGLARSLASGGLSCGLLGSGHSMMISWRNRVWNSLTCY